MSSELPTQPVDCVLPIINPDFVPAPINIERFIEQRKSLMHGVYNRREIRERILNNLFFTAKQQLEETSHAHGAIVFGTSFERYPDKAKKRAYWAAMLWNQGKVESIICTGENDRESEENEAPQTKAAIRSWRVPGEAIYVVGGHNTQENVAEAKKLAVEMQCYPRTLFTISENRHLVRAMSVAKAEFGDSFKIIANPVGGLERLDPDDPRVILELTKAVGYNHIKYRVNKDKDKVSDEQVQYVHDQIRAELGKYEYHWHDTAHTFPNEPSFEGWLLDLPSEYQISTAAHL